MTGDREGPSPRPGGGAGKGPDGRAGGPADDRPDEEGPIGIFPSWRWLYGTVLAWFVVVVLALYVLTVALDFGAP